MIETSVPCGRVEELRRRIEESEIPYHLVIERRQLGTHILIKLRCTIRGRGKDANQARSEATRELLPLLDQMQGLPSLQ